MLLIITLAEGAVKVLNITSRRRANFEYKGIRRVLTIFGVCLLLWVVQGVPGGANFRLMFGATNLGVGLYVGEAKDPIHKKPAPEVQEGQGVWEGSQDIDRLKRAGIPTELLTIEMSNTIEYVELPEHPLIDLPETLEVMGTPSTEWRGAASENVTSFSLNAGTVFLSERDLWEWEAVVWAEARGEGLYGMIKVAEVIRNRIEHDAFPDTLRGVIAENDGRIWQFCPVRTRAYLNYPSEGEYGPREAVRRALSGTNLAQGATYFRGVNGLEGSWHQRVMHSTFIYRNHFFGQAH